MYINVNFLRNIGETGDLPQHYEDKLDETGIKGSDKKRDAKETKEIEKYIRKMKQTNKSDLMLLFLAVMYENCI
jgi:hypothetical protein